MNNKIIKYIREILPGFLVALSVALVAIVIAKFLPKLGAGTISIFLGIIVGNLFLNQDIFQKGYKFSETDILSYSIVLLGATLSVSTLLDLGLGGFIFIVMQMTITIVGAIFIGKKLGFNENFRFLMASGNAVCGSSAIAATAPVIDADDKDKGIAITIVNITGIVLMFALPLIGRALFKSDVIQTGALIGGTLQSVGQVAASGAMVGEEVKDIAMIFKILRVVLLVVVVFVFGTLKNKSSREIVEVEEQCVKKRKVKIPWYVIGFFISCALFSLRIIPVSLSHICKVISNNLEVIALAAIGLRVNIKLLLKQGKVMSLYALGIGLIQIISAIMLIFILIR